MRAVIWVALAACASLGAVSILQWGMISTAYSPNLLATVSPRSEARDGPVMLGLLSATMGFALAMLCGVGLLWQHMGQLEQDPVTPQSELGALHATLWQLLLGACPSVMGSCEL